MEVTDWQRLDSIYYYINPIRNKESCKIAAFDWDHTIIKPNKTIHPQNINDWKFCYQNISDKLLSLSKEGYLIIVFSNQSALNKPDRKDIILGRIKEVLRATQLPLNFIISGSNDKYRKPNTGMWDILDNLFNISVDKSNSFYVGDAAGRQYLSSTKKDFSSSDRYFAYNIGIPFMTPEEYFLNDTQKNYVYIDDLPLQQFKLLNSHHRFCNPHIVISKNIPELIIMVGYPSCGKSSFVKKYLLPTGYICINQDKLKYKSLCIKETKKQLSTGNRVVIDNTNPDVKTRQLYIDIANSYNIPTRCFYLNVDMELAQHLNNLRMITQNIEKISSIAYYAYRKKFELPTLEEGFQEIVNINFVPEFKTNLEEKIFYQYS